MKKTILSGLSDLPGPLLRALTLFYGLYLVCAVAEIWARVRHWGYPYVWPLSPPYPPFVDFRAVIPRFAKFGTRQFFSAPGFPFTYPAPLALVFRAFRASPKPLTAFLVFNLLVFGAAGALFTRALARKGLRGWSIAVLVAAYAVSFPMWFALEQGNCEFEVCLIVALGFWAFLRDRPLLAATLLGLAGAMKLFPFVYLGLFLARRQYRAIALGCLVAVAVTLASLWLETGSVAVSWHGTVSGLEYFRQHWALAKEGSGFDHSLFGMEKRLAGLGGAVHQTGVAGALRRYTLVTGLALAVLFFTRVWRMPILNQILALTVLAVLVPPVSFDYTLIHLYVPCALIVLLALRDHRGGSKGVLWALPLLGVLLAPETEFIRHGVSFGGEIKCVALVWLLGVSLRWRLEEPGPPAEGHRDVEDPAVVHTAVG